VISGKRLALVPRENGFLLFRMMLQRPHHAYLTVPVPV
jgi:hypothetical protein